ncbi:hypothetical protein T4D_13563 [Trichinella pseudospiralis]|uniref:Uncharacterized protein n=1 Tax=Trichinella pseudospiralis TaxID=6337 RepID=A0A0V1G811_TRIPS|nr:hypothetical protein T4D_13563 [Trichinella pseudospiralis]
MIISKFINKELSHRIRIFYEIQVVAISWLKMKFDKVHLTTKRFASFIVHIRICDKYFLAIVMHNDLLKCFLRKNNSIQEDLIELALNYLIKMSTLLTYGISDSSEQTKLISLSISKLNPLIVLWYYIPVRVGVMEQHESQHFLTFLSLARLQKAQHCLLY